MAVSFEKIEELRKRANISYADAEFLLEKHDGDILQALIELERNKKTHPNSDQVSNFIQRVHGLYRAGNRTKFIITRNGDIVVNVPVNYLLLSLIISLHLAAISLIIVFVTGCKMSIKKFEGQVMNVDDVIIDLSKKVKNAAKNLQEDQAPTEKTKPDDTGYAEHTVE